MNKEGVSVVDRSKATSIKMLFMMAVLIVLSGIAFSIYSVIENISFPVMNQQVHGAVWGSVLALLGLRYFFSVQKLKVRVYQPSAKFSWSNFKSDKTRQT